ncbi:hypothetical protein GLX27_000562 [Malassezia furfur]|uniref:Programmed cell death protein 2 C-terminal domain-containing protein n=1 Tax=Malassezia furfur TaxID=55194 RepID=A0ABY8ENA7_MALFU|nr:hypothetical protein GLX27_000562 [Malassezia furfur]
MLKYNARWAAKLEKQRKKQEAHEARLAERKKKEADAEAEKARRERATNPFSMSSTSNGNSLFGSGSLFSSTPQLPEADKKEDASAQNTPSETNDADEAEDDTDSEYDEEERLAEELAIKASIEQQREQLGADNDWAATAPCYTPALYLNTIPEPSRTSEKLEPPSKATLERAAESGADMDQGDEEEYERMRVEGIDEVFERFTERLGSEARQVVRYEFDGVPLPFTGLGSVYRQLWPANKYDGSKVPPCPHCGAPRVFEVQLMPNLANLLRAEQLKHRTSLAAGADDETRRRAEIASTLGIEVEKAGDGSALPTGIVWSTAIVFVCSKDCSQNDGEGWAEEWVAVQFEQEI